MEPNRRFNVKMRPFFGILTIFLVLLFALCSCDMTKATNPGSISGYIAVEDNASKAGVIVKATGSDGTTSFVTSTDKYGFFCLEDVVPDEYSLSLRKTGYYTIEKTVKVEGGKSSDIGTVLLSINYGYIKGKVIDENSNPLAGATVTVTGTGLNYSGTTDAEGYYSIQAKPGTYKAISFAAPCHYLQDDLDNVTVKSEKDSTIDDYQLQKNHKYEIYEKKEATSETEGYRKYRCADCGDEKTEVLPMVTGAKWAGIRVSSYGMYDSFGRYPNVDEMLGFAAKMESCYSGSTGSYILIVGTIAEVRTGNVVTGGICMLDFPLSKEIQNATGEEDDAYEAYLTAMDKAGYSVWLQVEPGDADLVELATEVMNRYKHHSCVKGFGIDVEWYEYRTWYETDKSGRTRERSTSTKLTASYAKQILAAVQSIDPDYTVFVKHWDERWLPSENDKGLEGYIYVTDSQRLYTLDNFCDEFADWAESFPNSPVMFQIGYDADEGIWGEMDNPAQELGQAILAECKKRNLKNDIGIIWVDFTLKEAMEKITED